MNAWQMNLTALFLMIMAVAMFLWWRRRRVEEESPMISIVALLREPQHLEPMYISTAARKAWGAELRYVDITEESGRESLGGGPDDDDDPDEGFIVGVAPPFIVRHESRLFCINAFSEPYFNDSEEVATLIVDLRLKSLVRDHQAWIACDAVGPIDPANADSMREWYHRIGKLLAELLDDNCLVVLFPETLELFPYGEKTLACLTANDPRDALRDACEVPVIGVADDSPEMLAAVAEARRKWDQFASAFETKAGSEFSVKAPITRNDQTEFIWLTVTAIEGDLILGTLANEPMNLGNLRLGSRVQTRISELNDWGYLDEASNFIGGFTIKAVAAAAKKERERKTEEDL